MTPWRVRRTTFLTTLAVAPLLFWTLVHLLRPGWESQEYVAIVVWTAPLALLCATVAPPLRRRLVQRRMRVRVAVTVLVAVASAVAWTVAAVALTGGYALAFDANPLWCWAAGGLAGLLGTVCWPAPRAPTDSPSTTAA